MTRIFLNICAFALAGNITVHSQCCSAGNPNGGDATQNGLAKKELLINLFYRYSLSEEYFHIETRQDNPLNERSYYDFSNLSVIYGISDKWSVYSEMGYFFDKAKTFSFLSNDYKVQASGFGDALFSMRYKVLQTVKPASQLIFSGGIKVPVGAFNDKIDGVTIPVSLQPSSGAFKFNAGLYYIRMRPDKKLGWFSFILYEKSNTIQKDFLTHKYGDYCQFTVAGNYNFFKNFSAIAMLKSEWRAKDIRDFDVKIESSGSRVLYFCPQLQHSFSNWKVYALYEIPVYKYMNGTQLANKFAIQFGVSKKFSLQGDK